LSHLSENEIERFLNARATPVEWRRVSRHLLAGCGVCSRKLIEWAPDRVLDEAAESRSRRGRRSPSPLRDRAVAAALEQDAHWRPDQKKLDRSLALLGADPQGYDGLTFRQVRSLHGQPLIEALLWRSWELRFHDPKAMRWLAYNAVKAAESLRPEEHGATLVFDLQARAWAELANAYKTNEEYAETEAAFARARALLRQGSGDHPLLLQIAWRESSLRMAQRRLIEARELLDGVHQLALRLEDSHLAGQVLLSKGLTTIYDDNPSEGPPLFRQGLALLDPDRDPEIVAIGQQGLITGLVISHQYREAGRLLLRSDLRRRLKDHPRVRWIEGKLLSGLGHLAKAESALWEVQEEFLALGQLASAANVGVDLLPILLKQGKYEQLRRTAREAYDILQSCRIQREAAKARAYLS
jgi:hypothetical protein